MRKPTLCFSAFLVLPPSANAFSVNSSFNERFSSNAAASRPPRHTSTALHIAEPGTVLEFKDVIFPVSVWVLSLCYTLAKDAKIKESNPKFNALKEPIATEEDSSSMEYVGEIVSIEVLEDSQPVELESSADEDNSLPEEGEAIEDCEPSVPEDETTPVVEVEEATPTVAVEEITPEETTPAVEVEAATPAVEVELEASTPTVAVEEPTEIKDSKPFPAQKVFGLLKVLYAPWLGMVIPRFK